MLPEELSREINGDAAQLQLQVSAGLPWFSGHFPGQPILPGVAQLDWVMHYGTRLLAAGWQFSAVENIKFQQPVQPGETLWLRLEWLAAKGQLTFSYRRATDDSAVSSGKISLCQ